MSRPRWRWATVPAAMLLCTSVAAAPAAPLANPAAQPVSRMSNPMWAKRFERKQQQLRRGNPELIFLGDSIIEELERRKPAPLGDVNAVWQKFYAGRNAIDLGFWGDTTANLLWRIENGELDGINPRVAVVLIGTNNLRPRLNWTPAETVGGINEVVEQIRSRLPHTRILLLAVLPNGYGRGIQNKIAEINRMLAEEDWQGRGVTFLNVGTALERNGALDDSLFLDPILNPPGRPLHPNVNGWYDVARAIETTLSGMLGDRNRDQ